MVPIAFLDTPQAPRDEEALWRALSGPEALEARQKLFATHIPFARRLARRLRRQRDWGDIEIEDVEQAAYAGLLEAMTRFEPSRGIAFRTYAAGRITGVIIDTITRMSEMREQITWRHQMRRDRLRSLRGSSHIEERSALQPRANGPSATASFDDTFAALAEIAVGLAVGFMLEGSSLYREDGDNIPPGGYESAVWLDMQASLGASLSNLPERERAILAMHYFDGLAFEQIAAVMTLSKGRVSQLHRSALERLGRAMRQDGHFKLER